jgi:hypothetical protein
MATKGKTRGPKEGKFIRKDSKEDPKSATKRKRVEKQTGSDRKP